MSNSIVVLAWDDYCIYLADGDKQLKVGTPRQQDIDIYSFMKDVEKVCLGPLGQARVQELFEAHRASLEETIEQLEATLERLDNELSSIDESPSIRTSDPCEVSVVDTYPPSITIH